MRLKQLRRSLSYTGEEMAARMGVSEGAYRKYEGGIRFPSPPGLRRLARKIDVSMDWLLFEKGPMYYSGKSPNQELEREIERLKGQLEEARRRTGEREAVHRKELEDQAQRLRLSRELQELVDYMNKNSILYHEVLAHFQRFKHDREAG
jgi:transcriptional regulator with XRE-family HTH domain